MSIEEKYAEELERAGSDGVTSLADTAAREQQRVRELTQKSGALEHAAALIRELQGRVIELEQASRTPMKSSLLTEEAISEHERLVERLVASGDVVTLKARLREREAKIAAEAAKEAYTDQLTGIMNRRGIEAEIGRIMDRLERTHAWRQSEMKPDRPDRESGPKYEGMTFYLVDLDFFKKLNDTEGHLAGDEALKAVAASLTSHLRKDDFVGRWGGEEFVVVITSYNPAARLAVAEKIRSAIAKAAIEFGGKKLSVTASIGIATWRPGLQQADMFQEADDALYRAKERGRNTFVDAEDLASERTAAEDAAKTLTPT